MDSPAAAGAEERAINTSELGTKEYWERFYETELENLEADGEDGECWFGVPLLRRLVAWTRAQEQAGRLRKADRILDVGCGGALFLIELAQAGFGQLIGVDYCEKAIRLARGMLQTRADELAAAEPAAQSEPADQPSIRLLQLDLLAEPAERQRQAAAQQEPLPSDCRLVFDKGTYDAVCLNPTPEQPLAELQRRYRAYLASALRPDGWFMLVSCNWTRQELLEQFVDRPQPAEPLRLDLFDEIQQPKIQFGGKVGSTVTCLIFRRADGV